MAFSQRSGTILKPLCFLFLILGPAYLTTRHPLPLFSGIEYIFGSFFIILAFHFFGFLRGLLTTAIVCITTVLIWGHPYAIPAFLGEALAFGLLRHRISSPLFIAMPYWLFIGLPSVYFLFHFGVGLESTASLVVALKQSCNAILNSATAGLFIIWFENVVPRKFQSRQSKKLIPLHHLALLVAAFTLSIILLISIVINSRIEMQRNLDELYATTQNLSDDIEITLTRWQETNLNSTILLAEQTKSQDLSSPNVVIQNRVENFAQSREIEIGLMYVANAEGKTIAAFPLTGTQGQSTIGLSYADRPYYQKIQNSKRPLITDVFQGRNITDAPIIGFVAPITINNQFMGFSFAGARLDFLASYIKQLAQNTKTTLSITSNKGLNIINNIEQPPLTIYRPNKVVTTTQTSHKRINQHFRVSSLNPIEANQLSYFVTQHKIPLFNWNLIIEQDAKFITDKVNRSNLLFLAIAFSLLYISVPLLLLFFRSICAPLSTLNNAFKDLTERGLYPTIAVPQSTIQEYQNLFQTLKQSSAILDENRAITKKLIRKLTASETNLGITLDSIKDGVISTDNLGRITRLNPTAEVLLGWNQKEIQGKPVEDFFRIIDIDSRKPVSSAITEVLSQLTTPEPNRKAILLDRHDKEIYIVENASEHREENFTLLGATLTFRNITSKYHYQKKIDNLHNKFSTIIENTSEGILLLDAELKVQFANKTMSELFCHEITEGEPCYKSVCSENHCQHCQALQTIQQKTVTSSKREFLTGKVHRVIATPILNEVGEVTGVVELAIDITEHEHSLMKLKKSEQRFKEFFNNNGFPCAICMPVVDDVGRMVSFTLTAVNPAYEQTVKRERADLLGHDIRDIFPDLQDDVFQRYVQVATTGIADHFFETHKSTESTYYCSVFKSAKDDLQFYLTFEDATEREKLEFQLFHSQKMDALGQLAGGVAHDFNNLLCAMVGYSELISAMAADRPVITNYANQITTTGKRATELTQKLLSFARKGKRCSEIFDIHTTIYEVSKLLERSINKNITVTEVKNATATKIHGDQSQLHNAFLNLGLNARDAMKNGGTLTLSTKNKTLDQKYCENSNFDISPGNYICIEASDTGSGMDEETLTHIFEPFFTTKEIGKGTGLGLPAIFGAITAHFGEITVTSRIKSGTCFQILLPLATITSQQQLPIPLTTQHIAKGSGTILVIDDEEIIRDMAKEQLNNLGYLVMLAQNGQEGLELYKKKQHEIDGIILDVVMPVMSGRDCFDALKKFDPDVKTIISSGFSRNDQIDAFKKAGADCFLAKPYDQKSLTEALYNLLHTNKILQDY